MTFDRPILLVEDNPDDAELTIHSLAANGIHNRIEVARDGAEAIEKLFGKDRLERLPIIVLLDLNLPKFSGLEVLERIRADERTRLLPVIVLTSSKQERDLVESNQLGANGCLQKPVDFDEFHDAARQLGMYWLMLDEPRPGV